LMVLENVAKLMFFISLANNHATFFIIFFQRFKELHQVRNISCLQSRPMPSRLSPHPAVTIKAKTSPSVGLSASR